MLISPHLAKASRTATGLVTWVGKSDQTRQEAYVGEGRAIEAP
jgi:hypothetical protein